MADFNQISVESSLLVQSVPSATLGFNDGYVFSKTKYALEDHMLTLNVNTTEDVTIFYNNGVASCYEFKMKLYQAGTCIPSIDLSDKIVNNLNSQFTLVFINGELQPTSAYEIENSTTLRFLDSYTKDPDRFFEVIVYTSSAAITRYTYTDQEIASINLDDIELSSIYNTKNTAIFINGKKVSFLAVEKINPDTDHADALKLNIPNVKIDSFEIITFKDTSTDSVNFITESGYLTYGPYDDYSKKVPILYDTIITLSDQAKNLIDNLRAGFIVREKDAYGELIMVDDTFESPEIRCIAIQKFRNQSYTKNDYYLEVPNYTRITKYLAEFDNKYTFLPEILLVFQRLLLDELHDSVQRLRDMRNIHKVDSVNVNRLLTLLGFNANIKTLNVKQRRELLEELNEFYRIVGTRYSYNLVNILQNNLKLINMEQLFTPYGLRDGSKKTIYLYDTALSAGGQGYKVGDYLKAADNYISVLVDDVNPTTGEILHYETLNNEGYIALDGEYPLTGGLEGYFNITSPTNQYTYNWNVTGSENCVEGQELQTSGGTYKLVVDETDGQGHITRFTPKMSTTGSVAILDVVNSRLYQSTSNLNLRGKITSTDAVTNPSEYELVTRFNSGIGKTYNLGPGKYYIKMSGGGGAGSSSTNASASGKTNGGAGEVKTYSFTIPNDTQITYYVGQGGGGVYAKGSNTEARQLGNGYEQGTMGQGYRGSSTSGTAIAVATHLNPTVRSGTKSETPILRMPSMATVSVGTVISTPSVSPSAPVVYYYVGGQGGGSSAIVVPAMDPLTGQPYEPFIARGGNGGNAKNDVLGGTGGSGGITNGSGANGSVSVQNDWSEDGSDGWIEIYRVKQNYTFTLDTNPEYSDTSHVTNLQEFNLDTRINNVEFVVTAHRAGDLVTFTLDHTQGYPIINTPQWISMAPISDTIAYLTITSDPSAYMYQVQLETDHTLVKRDMVFTGSAGGVFFTYTVTRVDNETGSIYGEINPTHGPNAINESYVPATYQTGTGGRIRISSEPSTQKNVDRCYIDFYTREELVDPSKGEGLVSYYKEDSVDYRTITEGTPNAPQFWVSGEPDIDYGSIANTLEITSADYDYGYITDKVAGEWIEYWNWERGSEWYPTNHVDLEMKIPVGVDITSYVKTFIEQFYNIASTVVFIHSIIESFYFGNEGDTNASNGEITTENGTLPIKIPSEAKPTFGIATGAPVTSAELIMTSNPHIQYMKPGYYYGWRLQNTRRSTSICYTLFNTPDVDDFVFVKETVNNEEHFVYAGKVSSVEKREEAKSTITIIHYTDPHGEVSQGYVRANTYDEPLVQKCTLNIVATPSNAQIMIASKYGFPLAQGTGTLSYTGNYGTEIIWSVRAGNNYFNRAAKRTLLKTNETKYIILEKDPNAPVETPRVLER